MTRAADGHPEVRGGTASEVPVKVLYIISWDRSGSTLLGNLLAELGNYFHAGELRTIWGKGLLRGRLCGCGSKVRDCELWSAILRDEFGDDVIGLAERAYAWQRSVVRLRSTPALLRMRRGDPLEGSALRSYAQVMRRLYLSIARSTGSRVIIDSSKRQADAALLALIPGIEPYFVHLVRDPRAVAYSWQRRKVSPGEGDDQEMLRYSPIVSTRNWMMLNLAAEALRRKHGPGRSMFVRYEDFVADPGVVSNVAGMVAQDHAVVDFPSTGVILRPNHTAGGNPGRFRTGPLLLRTDDEWIRAQARRDRVVATTMSLPLLRRYGYEIFPRVAR